ncbi:hypothetical protein [Kurthia sp. Dielmo]|uniref:hypothetical protein n=1 Tax=Kurthia sp. Dielmo TaxID=1033738 RepID=UPI0011239F75|nr:hypothetical protein [Kurthia sp. Dielmo]
MNKLKNNQKLYVLYVKGHFSDYEDVEATILIDEYALEKELLTESIRLSFLIHLFDDLVQLKAVSNMNYNTPVEWVLNEIVSNAHQQRSVEEATLENMLIRHIQYCLTQDLELQQADKTILQSMKLDSTN